MHQNCSILASTNMFGDPCPNTLKYLEAHYQCVPASTTSTTNRPSPPWLITSQPTVWRSTAPPIPKNPIQAVGEKKKPTVITPPTFRPHITLPPEVKLGDIGTKKTTTRQPEPSSSEREPQTPKETVPETKIEEQDRRVVEENSKPRNDKPSKDIDDVTGATEESIHWKGKEVIIEETGPVLPLPPKEIPDVVDVQDEFDKRFPTLPTPTVGGRAYCTPKNARGLHWNWTLAGTYSVQPCPGGATGLARWRCNLTPAHHSEEEERPRRRSSSLQSGENYLDLGLEAPSERQLQLMRRLGSEALLKGRDGDTPVREYRGTVALPESQASSVNPTNSNDYSYDATPEWHGATPDLSECRSVWLNSLEARVREGESLLSVSSDLAQVTSSKTLYGGDMMTTTNIMRKLVQRMAQNVQTFPDSGQREALVTDMLLGVIKTGSNLLEESQRASWMDLSPEAQNKAASALLTQLEENAFLLADAITSEKNILQTVKNICLSVRVVELRNLEDETFPSVIAQEQWHASENTITIPKAALLENRQKDLVRIVFFSFDRLEEILPPVFGKTPQMAAFASEAASSTSLNTDRQARNMARVINSKVISASLGNGRHIQLSQTVKLTMKHLHSENVTNPICVFWDYTLHGWSPEGCEVEWSNTTHTGCVCSHLTNFAILMDVHGTRLGSDHELALRLLTFIGCAISAVALLAAIVVFQCFRNMKSDRVLIHKNLCACLLIAEVIFMCGIDQTQVRVLCGVIAGLLHYFFLAAFAWMFLEGFHLYAMLVEVFEPERPRARWYCIAAYATPALVVIASAAAYPQGYGTRRHCWLSTDRMFVMSFVGPVALVLAANWICLSMVIYMMCTQSTVSIKAKENSKLYKIRVWLNSSLVLAFLLGLTWTFGLLYLNEQTVGVAYAFTVLNSLQGLFIFIFHCLQNEIFQKECARLGRRHPWLSCCLYFTGQTSSSQPIPNNNAATASSSNHVDTRQGSVKSRRYHQSTAEAEDVVDPRDGITNTSTVSASTTNNLVINNLNVVVNNNNHNNNNVINNAEVASLAAAAAAHSYHSHRNRRDSQENQSFGNFGPTLNASGANFNIQDQGAPMSHLRNPLNSGSGRHPYRQNYQQEKTLKSYNIQPEAGRWNIRPSAPVYVPNDEARGTSRVPTPQNPQNIPHSSSHTQSIASMHSQFSYRNNLDPTEYQNLRSRSPSSYSNKGNGADWALLANPIGAASVNWKNTSSKHHPGSTATLSHHDTLSRQLAQQNMAPYDCETPPSPRHGKDEDALHHQGYQTTRSYHSDFRNPHVYLTQHSPGSQEMIFRKHYKDDRRKHHHHQNPGHTYQEIAAQQGRIYRRGSEQEFRAIQDDPVYEEIERNETLISDVSDDNSGPDCRQNPHHAKFYGDHRPLISYSPGERHHDPEHYDKYGKWDSLGRNYDRHAYESGRLMGPYHQPQENNMRAFAAVLNRENNVVCHLEPHNSYDVYQPQSGGNRTVSQPSF
ncbi:Latrophilin Cirl [Eumeta japonica]|uniref:Latrophilin Cirl n=1 Tax=Eumeta variegata TaxID=151549 RepID=A0A4C1TXQ8_EUMVA|nr:Latrophilin Cirl [Eumeta japonica]